MPGGEERHCPRCGTPYVPGQEYCLECGLRLGLGRGLVGTLSTAWRERFAWYPGDWIWPVLFGLVIAVIGGTVAALIAHSGKGSSSPLVATHPGTPRQPVTPPVIWQGGSASVVAMLRRLEINSWAPGTTQPAPVRMTWSTCTEPTWDI